MADALVSYFLENLSDQIKRGIGEFVVKDEIEYIRRELKMMQSFLKDADARQHHEEVTRHWVREIRRFCYRIEGALETYAISVEPSEGKFFGKFLSISPRLLAGRRLVLEIRDIKDNIENLTASVDRYRSYRDEEQISNSANEGNRWLNKVLVTVPPNEFVGLKADISLLVSFMVEEDKNCPVTSLYGMRGTGKTALARELYNCSAVRGQFEGFAWVWVGQKFDRRKCFEDISRQLVPGEGERQTDITLAKLNEIQREKKCLVVLDDVWDLDVWESLRVAFPFGTTTSKILLTTRMREVAAEGKGYIHTMRRLTEEESWELFKRKAFSSAGPDFNVPSMMVDIGREMVRKCQGLPLAIDMLGNFMATKHIFPELETLYRILDSYQNAERISEIPDRILALSFYDLHHRLRPCFLYLGCFPEESEIEIEKLYLIWMAEGMTESEDSGREETVMEIADKFLRELELRRLVEVHQEEVPTHVRRFKSCSLLGGVRQFCLTKGEEDEFVKVIDFCRGSQLETDSFASDCPLRRLVICLDKYEDGHPVPSVHRTAKYLRCLIIFNRCENQQVPILPQGISVLSNFKVLKILDFDGLDFRKINLPQGIPKLIGLRYLSFKGCVLEELPLQIGSLLYLLVLDLRVRPVCKMTIPNVLWKFKRLKHLYLPEAFQTVNHDMLRLDGLTELETLQQFNTNLCRIKDVFKMENLRYLATCTEGRVEDLECIISRMKMTARHILRFSVHVRNFDCYSEERHSVFRQLMDCGVLQTISMEGYIGQIPAYPKISQSLMEIVFSGSELKQDPMQVFEELPNLRVLVLNDDAYLGKEMVCSATSFRELRRLELSNLHNLEKWGIENGALSKLTTLAIENCSRLARLPDGVKFVSNLQKLKIGKMPQAFEKRLRQINGTAGEDMDNVNHVHSIIFYN